MVQPFLFMEMISYEFCSHGRSYLQKPLWVLGKSWLNTWKGWSGALTGQQNSQLVRTLRTSRRGMVVRKACAVSEEGMPDEEPICLGVSDVLEANTVTDRAFQARFGFLTSDGGRVTLWLWARDE